MKTATRTFDPDCRLCSRLVGFLDDIKQQHPDYHCRPVDSFGAADARLLIVGLAPGMHGANASGRPFTGDASGELLYKTLHDCGFASRPVSQSLDDGLELFDCRITNAVKCLPPQNKPTAAEVNNCNRFLREELKAMPPSSVIVALGKVAHDALIRGLGLRLKDYPFGHGNEAVLEGYGHQLIDSYHCSRYNTQTRRLTPAMFTDVFIKARSYLDD